MAKENEINYKLNVLSKIGKVLNENNITWAVGASLLLYFKNKTNYFNDIDLMVVVEDVEKLKSLFKSLGTLTPPNPNIQYKTKHFLEYVIDGVEVDIMAGFIIVYEGKDYDCSLRPETIKEHITINGVDIPLHSLDEWRKYYTLMQRPQKVEMIDNKTKSI